MNIRERGREKSEFEEHVLDIARVTRVQKGGKRMRFRASVVVGDKKGRVGFAIAKGADVAESVGKAIRKAERHLVSIPIEEGTIPHAIRAKFGAAEVLLKPAPTGTGIMAGGPVRVVAELAGIKNISSKMLGSSNKINNVQATLAALTRLRTREAIKKLRASRESSSPHKTTRSSTL